MRTVLSFAFFIAYDFFYLQPKQELVNESNAKNKISLEKKNIVSNSSNLAPVSKTQVANTQAPSIVTISKIITTINTLKNKIEIDNLGRIHQVTLKERQYVDENEKSIELFDINQLKPLEVRFSNRSINEEAFKIAVTASKDNIDATKTTRVLTLTQKLTDTTHTKILTFYPDGHYDIHATTTNNADFFITTGFRPNVLADMYADHGALLILNDGSLTIIEDEDMDRNVEFVGIQAVSAFDRYYTTVLYNYNTSMAISVMKDSDDSPQVFIHAKDSITFKWLYGSKRA